MPSPLISCMLARRTAFERVGPLRTDLNAEFVEWYLRARETGLKLRTLDALLVKRRIHSGQFHAAAQGFASRIHSVVESLSRPSPRQGCR